MTPRAARLAVTLSAQRVATDRGALAVTAGFHLLVAGVLAALWRAAAAAQQGSVAGYDARALTWYVIASEAAIVALNIRLIEEIGDDIGSGAVAVEMLRPVGTLELRLATQLGQALPRLAACLVSGTLLGLVAVGPPPSPAGAALAVPALVLAIACNLAAQHAFAALAFWVRDAKSTWYLYQKLVFIAGGMLIPLEALPEWLQAVVEWLPFVAMAYVPARLLSGAVEPHLLAVQLAWLVVLTALAAAAFRAGERRLQVVGG